MNKCGFNKTGKTAGKIDIGNFFFGKGGGHSHILTYELGAGFEKVDHSYDNAKDGPAV